jgi:hypothetical protein
VSEHVHADTGLADTTVAAFMMKTPDCQPFQTEQRQARNNRSAGVIFGRSTERKHADDPMIYGSTHSRIANGLVPG